MKRTRFMPVFSSLNINQCLYLSLKIAFEAVTLKIILQSQDIIQPFLTDTLLHRQYERPQHHRLVEPTRRKPVILHLPYLIDALLKRLIR